MRSDQRNKEEGEGEKKRKSSSTKHTSQVLLFARLILLLLFLVIANAKSVVGHRIYLHGFVERLVLVLLLAIAHRSLSPVPLRLCARFHPRHFTISPPLPALPAPLTRTFCAALHARVFRFGILGNVLCAPHSHMSKRNSLRSIVRLRLPLTFLLYLSVSCIRSAAASPFKGSLGFG